MKKTILLSISLFLFHSNIIAMDEITEKTDDNIEELVSLDFSSLRDTEKTNKIFGYDIGLNINDYNEKDLSKKTTVILAHGFGDKPKTIKKQYYKSQLPKIQNKIKNLNKKRDLIHKNIMDKRNEYKLNKHIQGPNSIAGKAKAKIKINEKQYKKIKDKETGWIFSTLTKNEKDSLDSISKENKGLLTIVTLNNKYKQLSYQVSFLNDEKNSLIKRFDFSNNLLRKNNACAISFNFIDTTVSNHFKKLRISDLGGIKDTEVLLYSIVKSFEKGSNKIVLFGHSRGAASVIRALHILTSPFYYDTTLKKIGLWKLNSNNKCNTLCY